MSGAGPGGDQRSLYWRQLEQVKAASVCARLYRNQLARRIRAIEFVKVIASSGGIAGWVVWKEFPFVWSGIIAAAQFLDAIKSVFPFARQHRAACDLTTAMELIAIDAEADWEGIRAGRLSDDVINRRRVKLQKLQLDSEKKHFPDGWEPSERLLRLASEEAHTYFLGVLNTQEPSR